MQSSDTEKLGGNRICSTCVGETYLTSLIEKNGSHGQCSYCGDTGTTITLEDLSEHVEVAFETHYSRTASEPNSYEYAMLKDKEIDYEWEREGQQSIYAIMDAARISEEIAEDVQAFLAEKHFNFDDAAKGEEGEFGAETHYEEIMPGDHEWQEGWNSFERTIKSEARFFSRTGAKQLSDLFDTIDEMETRQGKSLIVDAGPNTNHPDLYRARVFQTGDKLEAAMIRPDRELGAPPSRFASSGRMNAKGISVFYGATTTETAIAEVRPPVGSEVATARFEITRPVRLLNLTALGEVHETGSIFNPNYAYRLGRMMFLRKLSSRIARPVMPDDQETEYLPTQAIADFLATEGKVPLDGIIFPSVQVNSNGLNIVLFHKAARCAEIEVPEGAEIHAHTSMTYEDGPEPDYTVTEEVPPQKETPDDDISAEIFDPFLNWNFDEEDYDSREETLAVDLTSMKVHVVNAVQFDTSDFEVTRHRWTKGDVDF